MEKNYAKFPRAKNFWYLLLRNFLAAVTKISFLEEKLGTSLSPPNFEIFWHFLRSWVLNRSATRIQRYIQSNSYTPKLDIKYRFTCGEWSLNWNVAVFQNIFSAIVWKFSFCYLRLYSSFWYTPIFT